MASSSSSSIPSSSSSLHPIVREQRLHSSSSSSQPVETAEIPASLKRLAAEYRGSTFCDFKIQKMLICSPMIDNMMSYIFSTYHLLAECQTALGGKLHEKLGYPSRGAFQVELSSSFYQYMQHSDSSQLEKLLNVYVKQSEAIYAQCKIDALKDMAAMLKAYIEVFHSTHPRLLQQSAYQILQLSQNPVYALSSQDHYRIAVKSHQRLAFSLEYFICGYAHIAKEFSEAVEQASKLGIDSANHYTKIFEAFCQTPHLSGKERNITLRFFYHFFKKCNEEFNEFFDFFEKDCFEDITKHYYSVIRNKTVDRIILSDNNILIFSHDPAEIDREISNYDARYVETHRKKYTSFVSRFEDISSYLGSLFRKIENYSKILKDVLIYAKLDDLTALKEEINRNFSSKRLEQFFLKDIPRFNASMLNREGIVQTTALLKADRDLMGMKTYFNSLETTCHQGSMLLQAEFSSSLQFAKQCYRDLFILPNTDPSPAVLLPPKPEVPKVISQPISPADPEESRSRIDVPTEVSPMPFVSSSSTSSSSTSYSLEESRSRIDAPIEVSPTRSVSSSSTSSSSASSLDGLKEIQVELSTRYSSLKDQCKSLGVPDALFNAEMHLGAILNNYLRLAKALSSPLSQAEVLAFVIDSVRYGTLAAEQMLTALTLHQNKPRKPAELRSYLSHSLRFLLATCRFPQRGLPAHLSQWVTDANRGEIIVRDLDLRKVGRKSLETLLTHTWFFVEEKGGIDPKGLLLRAIEFSSRAVEFSLFLVKELSPAISDLSESMKRVDRRLSTLVDEMRFERSVKKDTPLRSLLVALRDGLEKIGLEHRLNNVLNNLLLRLETENLSKIDPKEAVYSFNTVLLHSQMIAEEVLEELLFIKGGNCSFNQASTHNLLETVKSLGITSRFTPDELSFLSFGSEIRQLVRYPANFLATRGTNPPTYIVRLKEIYVLAQKIADGEGSAQENTQFNRFLNKNLSCLMTILQKVLKETRIT